MAPTAILDDAIKRRFGDTALSLDPDFGDVFDAGDYLLMQNAPAGVPQFEVVKITTDSGAGDYVIARNQDATGLMFGK